MRALGGERWPVTDAGTHVPPVAGLYAIYGGADAWPGAGCVLATS